MSPLHGLRLNCILAPSLAAVVGLLALVIGWRVHVDAMAQLGERTDRAAIVGLAELAEVGVAPTLDVWRAAHADWSGLARIVLQDDQIVVLEQTGDVQLASEATPDLVLAYQAPRSWRLGGGLAVYAAPCLPRVGTPSLLVGWREAEPAPTMWPWLALAGGVTLIGGGLGLYLVMRIYRPVVWMQQAAAAAAAGQPEPAGEPDSPETASLRSTIATLIAKRRHSDG